MDWWHALDRELYELCRTDTILDRVESLLGPDFYLWGTQFFAKDPGDGKITPWHQDAYYWPLHPQRSVTVWLAFADSDRQNGAMQVIPGSHLLGPLRHEDLDDRKAVLPLRLADGLVDPKTARYPGDGGRRDEHARRPHRARLRAEPLGTGCAAA